MWVGLHSDNGAKTKHVEIPRRVSYPVGLKPDPQGAAGFVGRTSVRQQTRCIMVANLLP